MRRARTTRKCALSIPPRKSWKLWKNLMWVFFTQKCWKLSKIVCVNPCHVWTGWCCCCWCHQRHWVDFHVSTYDQIPIKLTSINSYPCAVYHLQVWSSLFIPWCAMCMWNTHCNTHCVSINGDVWQKILTLSKATNLRHS